MLSGTGVRVTADRPVFDAAAATLFDPLDERSFAYLLPLSPSEALLESATFDSAIQKEDETPLLRYLRTRYPGATFAVTHAEHGHIPLGFAPSQTAGPRHVLLGTKRGLVKPSAGYGVVRIAEESKRLAGLWKQGRPLPPSQRSSLRWRLLDVGFLQLAAQRPPAAAGSAAKRHARRFPRPIVALHRRGASAATAGSRLLVRAPGRARKTVAPAGNLSYVWCAGYRAEIRTPGPGQGLELGVSARPCRSARMWLRTVACER